MVTSFQKSFAFWKYFAMGLLYCFPVSFGTAQSEMPEWQTNKWFDNDSKVEIRNQTVKQVNYFDEDLSVVTLATEGNPKKRNNDDGSFQVAPSRPAPVTPFPEIPKILTEIKTESQTDYELSPADNQFIGFEASPESPPPSSTLSDHGYDLIWWKPVIGRPMDVHNQTEKATTADLLQSSLIASPRIQAISKDPLIREAQVIEADAEFDPVAFARNLFEDRTDPVGNTLTTGGANFLEDHIFSSDTGIRRKLRTGADVEVSQQLGFQNSNSQFFVPQDQGTATLAINVSQPILRGRGKYFNRLQIMIAQSAGEVAWEVFSSELQDELQRVLSAYWQLYFDRANFLQIKRNVERGEKILLTLEQRQSLDSLPSQIARARSAVQARRTDLANAFRDVRNAETNIRRLTGDTQWLAKQSVEILPIEHPFEHELTVPIEQVVLTAIDNRPEIKESAQRVKIAAFQRDVSTNELLPNLTMLLGTYVSGLEGGSGIERAWVEQFSNTTPGYSMGFEFELPVRNRAARSRLTQSSLQIHKLEMELQENIQRVVAESQIAYRRVESAVQTLRAAKISIEAAHQDLIQQEQRFETFALIEGDLTEGQSPTTLLDQLLDSQERLTSAESIYAQAVLELQVASIALNRATGTLLIHEKVCFAQVDDCEAPSVHLYRENSDRFDSPEVLNNH